MSLDNARYNHSKQLPSISSDAGKRIVPIYLLAYAPNLNLIERFQLFAKKKALWNRYYETFADFREAIRNVFRSLGSFSEELNTTLTPNFHIIDQVQDRILAA